MAHSPTFLTGTISEKVMQYEQLQILYFVNTHYWWPHVNKIPGNSNRM